MLTIKAGPSGDFLTISEALEAVPYSLPAIIKLEARVYQEKVFCDKKNISFIGEGPDKTVITWGDGAKHVHPDGRNFGTFRTYTVFLGGEKIRMANLSVVNSCGDGRIAGQGIAVYANAEQVLLENVHLFGRQDTLFCGPLPEKERIPKGFLGPREYSPRVQSSQYYKNCLIEGDVDFIFGGADAVFDGCDIVSQNRGEEINGYVTAPSGYNDGLGFVFRDCRFTGKGCADGSVFLGRPWRPEGKAALLRCFLDRHIHSRGWSYWDSEDGEDCFGSFAEFGSSGPGSDTSLRPSWVKSLTNREADNLDGKAENIMQNLLD